MIKKSHNATSKEFMQKILIFIDALILNITETNADSSNKILINGVLNVRDALLAEIIKDNQIDSLNKAKAGSNDTKKKQDHLNQEQESAKGQ
tara:strand:+ start:330 stop:605 length:276 start_codon:yes stop_codon:yes gene_type:complete